MGRLEGKSVIITGAGSGIGRAASLLFTKEGAKLIAVDRTEARQGNRRASQQSRRHRGSRDGGCRLRTGRQGVHRPGGVEIRQARRDLGQCRHQRRTCAARRADRRALAGNPAHQPDRPVPRHQICHAAHDRAGTRRDRLHRFGRGPEVGRQRSSLRRQQGRRDQPGADHGLFAVRHRACGSTRSVPA